MAAGPAEPTLPVVEAQLESFPGQELGFEVGVDLGRRERAIVLAALGAAVLSRRAFASTPPGDLAPLEIQLLVYLALTPEDEPTGEPGANLESLDVTLQCDPDDLDDSIHVLRERRLIAVVEDSYAEETRVTLTHAGVTRLEEWLRHVAPLFGRWPPDNPDVDDVTG